MISQSSEGLSIITTEFNLDVTSTTAAQDVRDKVASVTAEFRDEIQEPIVERYDPTANAVMSIVFESDNMDVKRSVLIWISGLCHNCAQSLGSERLICWVMHSARSGFRCNRKTASLWHRCGQCHQYLKGREYRSPRGHLNRVIRNWSLKSIPKSCIPSPSAIWSLPIKTAYRFS